ncbi:hypothetical protein CVS40_8290 [Lucilia cuprina]|nr:hypothetical protein CVS40_8290 [Lucilia cuprina]
MRKIKIQKKIKDAEKINENMFKLIIQPLLSMFCNFGQTLSNEIYLQVTKFTEDIQKIFVTIKTEHLLKTKLMEEDLFQSIEDVVVDSSGSMTHKKGKLEYAQINKKIAFMAMRDCLQNIVQGDLWKKKCELYPNEIVLPYFLYSDDLEINNPFPNSANTICNFYYSFPCLPNDTKLQNVLEVDGVKIKLSNGEEFYPHFIPILILGDNLGLNSLLGFSKSFNTTFCRFCTISKTDSQKTPTTLPELRRTYENYNLHVQENNAKESGISEKCIFNRIPSFHVVDNMSVDAMHDVMEGICHYDMTNAILKAQLEYGELEIGNISQNILLTHIKKKHLRMSAREMLTFVIFFPIMVGYLVSSDDEVWLFILLLIEIIDFILLFKINASSINAFKVNIENHNKLYLKLFKENLKPKFHILTHYPDIIALCGPVRKFWSFHFEARHRIFKSYSHSITSRKNVSVSIARKYQFYFSNYLLSEIDIKSSYNCLDNDKSDSPFLDFISCKLKKPKSLIKAYDKVIYNNVLYKKGFFVATRTQDYKIYKIINAIVSDESLYLFVQEVCNTIYLKHYTAFEINPNDIGEFALLNTDSLVGPPTTIINTSKGKFMIRTKEYF